MENATPKPFWTSKSVNINGGVIVVTLVAIIGYAAQSPLFAEYKGLLEFIFGAGSIALVNLGLRPFTVRPISLTDERPPAEFR